MFNNFKEWMLCEEFCYFAENLYPEITLNNLLKYNSVLNNKNIIVENSPENI